MISEWSERATTHASELESVVAATQGLQSRLAGRSIDLLATRLRRVGAGTRDRLCDQWNNLMLLLPQEGAQTVLFAATQPVERGACDHNIMSRTRLSATDPARDEAKARALRLPVEQLGREDLR